MEITLLHIYEEKYFNVMWLCIKQIEIIQVFFFIMNIQCTFELLCHIPYLLQYNNWQDFAPNTLMNSIIWTIYNSLEDKYSILGLASML